MASIFTRAKFKEALNITVTTYDDLIDDLIPGLVNFICEELDNFFLVPNVWVDGYEIAIDKTNKKITDGESQFVSGGFKASEYVLISYSKFNNNILLSGAVAADSITIDDIFQDYLTDENDSTETIRVSQVRFPTAMLKPAASLLYFDMKSRDPSIKMQKLDDWSEQYSGEGDYPKGLLKRFDRWRQWGAVTK